MVTETISSHLLICINLLADPMVQTTWKEGPLSREMVGIIRGAGLLVDRHSVKGGSCIDSSADSQHSAESYQIFKPDVVKIAGQ